MTSSDHEQNFITVRELIDLAIEFEIESAEFYRNMQKKAEDENVLEILKLLEKQEMSHEKILREYEIGPPPHAILQFGPSFSLAMPGAPSQGIDIFELLDIALERETKAAKIYGNSAAMVKGDLRKILEGLATFEREHEERVKSLKRYMTSEKNI
jgi:rubrerythrin